MGSTRVVGCLKTRGTHVGLVFGSSYRHHSKCASIDRRGAIEAARITAYEAKVETARMVSQWMQEGTKTCNKRGALAAQLAELEKSYKRSEGQASCRIEPNFADILT